MWNGGVPVARRQLLAEPAKLIVALAAVAAAVALVLLLSGLRRGIGEQVTTYLDRQPRVLVGQAGARDFLSQTSVLPPDTISRIARVTRCRSPGSRLEAHLSPKRSNVVEGEVNALLRLVPPSDLRRLDRDPRGSHVGSFT
jgi:hypothetical protein